MSLDMTSFDAALKELYRNQTVPNLEYSKNPFLAMVPKMTEFYGDKYPLPVRYGGPQGRSATFANAQTNKGNSSLTKFELTHVRDYSLASIDGLTLEASQSDKGAFIRAAKLEIDGALQTATRSLARALFRDGSGAIGRVTTGGTGTSITLTDTNDVVNFEVGQELQFCATKTGSSVKSGNITVTAVNRTTGVLTTDAASAIDGGSGTATNDFIYQMGDYDGMIKGLDAWISDAASPGTLFGVTRTTDRTRLAGVYKDGSSTPIEEALIDGLTLVAREGGRPDTIFINFNQFSNLEKALGAKVQYGTVKSGEFGFSSLKMHGPNGTVDVVPDHNCENDAAYLLQMDTFQLCSIGPAPKILTHDGNKMLRETSSDGVEIRCGYYAQLGCNAPGYNGRVLLAT